MMKKTYIKPKATAVEIHQQLLHDVSGENQQGEGWGGNYAKESYLDLEIEEEETKKKQTFIINW